ncbi:MAG: acyl-[acyl-carrier-protein]--UDP-N-acetylglucosamine O-acyltransferase [Deltaproteobacteria bacterium RBG_16_58_17]|nr:MAG: acyl-[acyl-carrier-protein]--UDP-N-acetylglucosamine O-acyltransferase [Deltaproteobacteria bacterium RBG_16_58_17]OHE19022.1 MAG: acyl-[acyl-carrier-protein]--UDP-N-acetylglucosamine O-acyltransferase [Syntrophobacterales bacterium GWC2_56_13]OHE20172.1 MAG: acyl-[acyl-carrier-protein]--UDP-N-acetylglucosamine O-acyltransferase [Syntrophobacterales bacterium GWF2_56_9]
MNIHPTAFISPDATLEEGVEVGPYSIVGPDVHIGKNTVIGPHVVIESRTDIGEGCRISPFASIGGAPQDLKYRGEETRVVIGSHNTIREYVTINRATISDIGVTIIGDHNLLMAYCHVAHNCKLGSHIVMANAANLAGHIHVEDFAIIGGLTGVHQFTRIGAHCIIGGASAVTKDIPPFVMASGNFAKLYGLNVIGLKRRGFTDETIGAIKEAYRIVFRSSLLLSAAIKKVEEVVEDLPEIRQFLDFIRKSERGICR